MTGEPGIGKTTLVDAFLAGVATTGFLWVAQGQCIEHYGAGEAYLPVLDALGQLCRGPGGERVVEVLGQQAPTWLIQMPALLRTTELEAVHRRVQGTTRERMLRELREAIEVLTRDTPLVLVLEDLHWSDAATLDLISWLARRREPARLLLLGTYGLRAWEAELHRLRGELLLRQGARQGGPRTDSMDSAAAACFRQALDIARAQGARGWELRAALSWSRLWQQQGQQHAARKLLAEVYGWFSEGFDTADLQAARALLTAGRGP